MKRRKKKLFIWIYSLLSSFIENCTDETKGIPYWKIAENFMNGVKASNEITILVSTIIIKEVAYRLGKPYLYSLTKLKKFPSVFIVSTIPDDYLFARGIEKQHNYVLGFGDCLHIAIAKRSDALLITRDTDLLRIGGLYLITKRPEELF